MTFAFDYGCRSLSYPHSFPTRRSSDLVDIRQEVSLTLRREYETARIEEVNDTPVITVIDPPVPPHERSSPKRLLLVLMRSEEHTSELQSHSDLVCRLLLEKKKRENKAI